MRLPDLYEYQSQKNHAAFPLRNRNGARERLMKRKSARIRPQIPIRKGCVSPMDTMENVPFIGEGSRAMNPV